MRLNQASTPERAQILPQHETQIETGAMSYCVSVIVLSNWVNSSYTDMRGYHGSGGAFAIDFESLFNGLRNEPQTQIYIFSGSSNNHPNDDPRTVAAVKESLAAARLSRVFTRHYHLVTNAVVTRSGIVTCS